MAVYHRLFLCSQDHNDGPKFHHLSLSAIYISHFSLQNDPEIPLELWLFQLSSHLSVFWYPPGTNFLESEKVDNEFHSLFRDSQFKNSVSVGYDHFPESFLQHIHDVTHLLQSLASPHKHASPISSCLNSCTQHLTVLTSILNPIHCLHTVMNVK